jgi:hypothetical protein
LYMDAVMQYAIQPVIQCQSFDGAALTWST